MARRLTPMIPCKERLLQGFSASRLRRQPETEPAPFRNRAVDRTWAIRVPAVRTGI